MPIVWLIRFTNRLQETQVLEEKNHGLIISVGLVSTTHSLGATDSSDNAFWNLTTLSSHYGDLKNALAMIGMGIYYCNIRNGLNLLEFPTSDRFQAKGHSKSPKTAK